jgi:hypothetical protein
MTIGARRRAAPACSRARNWPPPSASCAPTTWSGTTSSATTSRARRRRPSTCCTGTATRTNLPGPMYCWYLRHTYLQNEAEAARRPPVCGEKVDLGAIEAPVFVYGSREDHIVPWRRPTVDAAADQASGLRARRQRPHRRRHQPAGQGQAQLLDQRQAAGHADAWFEGATEHPGSWWTTWSDWLKPHGGKLVNAPKAPGKRATRPSSRRRGATSRPRPEAVNRPRGGRNSHLEPGPALRRQRATR